MRQSVHSAFSCFAAVWQRALNLVQKKGESSNLCAACSKSTPCYLEIIRASKSTRQMQFALKTTPYYTSRILRTPITILLISGFAIGQTAEKSAQSGRDAFSSGNYAQAVELFKRALANGAASAEVQSDLGLAYQMEGDHPQAIHHYVEALRLQDLPKTRELLAIERCRFRDYSNALPLLTKIANDLSSGDRLIDVLSPCYLLADDALDAIKIADNLSAAGAFPADQLLIYRGDVLMQASNFFISQLQKTSGGGGYLQFIQQARDTGSENARGGFESAIARSSYLRPDLSIEDGLSLFAAHSSDPALLYMLGVIAGEKSMDAIQECQSKYPDSPWLAQFKAQMFANQGQYEQAEQIYKQLLDRKSTRLNSSH